MEVEQEHADHNWVEAFFNYATIGIVVTNRQGLIINFNRQAERDFGYKREEIINQQIEVLLPQSAKHKHILYREGYYKHPSPRPMGENRDLYAQKKDGSIFPVEVSLSNYTIDDQLYVIAFVINITVRKEHEQLVMKQKEELENVTKKITQLNIDLEKKIDNRTKMLSETLAALQQSKIELSDALKAEKDLGELKSKFVSMASHEFKTPLSTILSSSFLLEKYNQQAEPDKRSRHINRIKNAVNDMKMILDDFLSVDKLDEGIIKPTLVTKTAEQCFNEIRELVQDMQLLCKQGQFINLDCDGFHNVVIDEKLLKNICINLISNAIKFSSEDAIINVNCCITPANLSLSVKDRGIGICPEDQEHLFNRFFRAKNADNIQGTGLGLHIVSKYLELLNGNIEFDSELNKGSKFTINIPQPNI